MASQITCECGFTARGASDDEVVTLAREHVRLVHPDLYEAATPDVLRRWVELVP